MTAHEIDLQRFREMVRALPPSERAKVGEVLRALVALYDAAKVKSLDELFDRECVDSFAELERKLRAGVA